MFVIFSSAITPAAAFGSARLRPLSFVLEDLANFRRRDDRLLKAIWMKYFDYLGMFPFYSLEFSVIIIIDKEPVSTSHTLSSNGTTVCLQFDRPYIPMQIRCLRRHSSQTFNSFVPSPSVSIEWN